MVQESSIELPQGFIWKECPTIRAKIPMPNTWFSNSADLGETKAVSLSKEPPLFKTGLTVNALLNIPRKLKVNPSEFAQGAIRLKPGLTPTSEIIEIARDPFVIYRGTFHFKGGTFMPGATMGSTEFYIAIIGNDKSGTLYTLSFETPSHLWSQNEHIARVMIEHCSLNPSL